VIKNVFCYNNNNNNNNSNTKVTICSDFPETVPVAFHGVTIDQAPDIWSGSRLTHFSYSLPVISRYAAVI